MNIRFGELADANPKSRQEPSTARRFVAMEDIEPGLRYVAGQSVRNNVGSGSRFEPGDVLFARITPCLENGKVAQYLPPDSAPGAGSTEFLVFRAKQDRADQSFVFYLARTHFLREPARLSMHGASGRQRANKDAILDALVPSFSLPAQRRIGSILSAYDDLIEVNRRRIAILEEMAHRLFDEWFVHFRFRGHETVSFANSPIGSAPAHWSIRNANDLIQFDPPTKLPKEGLKPFVPMNALSTNSMVIENAMERSGNGGSKFINGDTLFARITPCLENGKTGYVDFLADGEVAFGSTEFIVMRGRTVSPEWVYLFSRTEQFRGHAIKSMSGASGRQRVREESLKGFLVAEPDPGTVDQFTAIARPIFKQIQVLARANRCLRGARDLLLPKLISGEIDLEHEARGAEAMARRVAAE